MQFKRNYSHFHYFIALQNTIDFELACITYILYLSLLINI